MDRTDDKIYDFIIVGGGPAGSTMATLLSRKGYQVLVLEKEQFPRPHVGESLLSQNYSLFEDLGVLEEMKRRFIRKPGVEFSDNTGKRSTEWPFQNVIKDESYLSFHVRRDEFDELLLENSRANGAKVIYGIRVTGVDLKSKPCIKVRGHSNGDQQFLARFLIDASGQQNFLNKLQDSKINMTGMRPKVAMHAHWSHLTVDESIAKGNLKIVRMDIPYGGWIWMIPLDKDLLSVGAVVDKEHYNSCRRDNAGANADWINLLYHKFIQATSAVFSILSNSKVVSKITINADYSHNSTVKFGDGFAKVGDAAAFVDPIFSSGVYIAMKSAFVLVDAIESAMLTGDDSMLKKAYDRIDEAYKVVKELVANFYDPKAIKIDKMGGIELSIYEQQKRAFEIFHLIITGKFFDLPKKYLDTIYLLRDEKKFRQFESYVTKRSN